MLQKTNATIQATYTPGTNHLTLLLCLAFIFLSGLFSGLSGQYGGVTAEDEDFAYIVELFYSSDGYLDETEAEILAFRSRYPDSGYGQYLDYLDANIALKKGDFAQSASLYQDLLEQDLHPGILNDIYLNYAISCYYLDDPDQGIKLLNSLELATGDPWFLQQAHIWRGRLRARQQLWLSAEQDILQARLTDPAAAQYDYFRVLLALERDSTAIALIDSLPADSPDNVSYRGAWLEYLADQGRYTEFDREAAILDSLYPGNRDIQLLKARKAFYQDDLVKAAAVLDSLNDSSETATYYKALLLGNTGHPEAADSLFKALARSQDPDLSYLAYLERLKILFAKDPEAAINQLESFLAQPSNRRGEAYHQLGVFHLDRNEYLEALRNLMEATNHLLPAPWPERNIIMSAVSYYGLDEYQFCLDTCNRYLNNYPEGAYRDRASYLAALSHIRLGQEAQARQYYEKLISESPASAYVDEAKFAVAEMLFQKAEYKAASDIYKDIVPTPKNYPALYLRLAQAYYFQAMYPEALQVLEDVLSPLTDFETVLLLGAVRFNLRQYDSALESFTQARDLATQDIRKAEASAYRAYTLFNLGRYSEAAELYLDLAADSLNADIYLYQAAKANAHGKDWHRALDLYEDFIEKYPDSDYYLQILADHANACFNLGRYGDSLEGWLNILRRYSSATFVPDEDLSFLAEVFEGIEMSVRKSGNPSSIQQVVDIMDVFRSDYIKFELQYIIVKLYANADLWEEVLREASEFRRSLALPEARRSDIGVLMLNSLVNLNRYKEADSLAVALLDESEDRDVLLKWAESAELAGYPELALERYQRAYGLQPDGEVWLKMADISRRNGYPGFEDIWEDGREFHKQYPEAQLYLMQFHYDRGDLESASALADTLLQGQIDPWIRANAELWRGKILFGSFKYDEALRAFRKLRLLYDEYADVYLEASYYYIQTLVFLDSVQEARLAFQEVQGRLPLDRSGELEDLLGSYR
jgi:tetratricopeptide (TPR) repeat protein